MFMDIFTTATAPSLGLLAYAERSKTAFTPPLSIQALKLVADRMPTALVSTTAHRWICVVGDRLAGDHRLKEELEYRLWQEARVKQLLADMEKADSLFAYEACTTELDILQGHDRWKSAKESIEPAYSPDIVLGRQEQLQLAAESGDPRLMLHELRTSLSRDLGGMSMLRMYKHSWFGTKELIDDYINTAVATIETFLETTERCSIAEALVYQRSLEDALKFFGRSALTLSGGALLGMKHIGVVKALWEADMLPDVISGASAGSIVAAVVGSSSDEEMEHALSRFADGDLDVFDPPGTGAVGWVSHRIRNFLYSGAAFSMENLERIMKKWLKDITFREAHRKTGRILNISVSSVEGAPHLLNHITAPDVLIWSAVCASCSVPIVFRAADIFEKDQITRAPVLWMQNSRQTFVDGSLDSDIPSRKLSEMFNVNFFIVSQVNPHVRAFIEKEEQFTGIPPTTQGPKRSLLRTGLSLARETVVHRLEQAASLGLFTLLYRGVSIVNQQYTGDLDIFPEIHAREYLTMLANPTPEFMLSATLEGEKATWPKMCRIKNSVAIELALVKAIREFRERANFSEEARAARQAARISHRRRSSSRGARPMFLRRRSLSITQRTPPTFTISRSSEPTSPFLSRDLRKSTSSGSLPDRSIGYFLPELTKLLSPQAGVDVEGSNEGLMMASPSPPTASAGAARGASISSSHS